MAACEPGVGLCTITNIEGSFSRRMGAQLAVHPDGSVTGSLADGCLEQELARQVLSGEELREMRFGAGSPMIDFLLPCGGGLDILIDPAPDHIACKSAAEKLKAREAVSLKMPPESSLPTRHFVPALRLILFGEGPELEALSDIASMSGMEVECHDRGDSNLSLGARPDHIEADPWSAIVLLFHDHEWESAILDWALRSPAFYIGAQGGAPAREERSRRLKTLGFTDAQIARIASPIGTVSHCREPAALALSVLAGIAGEYEVKHPHHTTGRS